MRLALVNLAIASRVLVAELKAQLDSPIVVGAVGPDPLRRRVIFVRALVRLMHTRITGDFVRYIEHAGAVDVPSRVQKLAGLKDHLDAVLVAVVKGAQNCVCVEQKKIHTYITYYLL